MLRLKCLIGLSTPQLRNAVVGQIKYQRDTLLSLRLRRHDIIAALDHAIDAAGRHGDDFSVVSHSHIKEAFDNFVADGTKWNGKGLSNNLNGCVNEIAYNCIHTLMLLQLLQSDEMFKHVNLSLNPLICNISEDVGALAKEKFSVSPSVSIEGDFVLTHTVPSLIEYIVVEMLKNSMKSVVDRYGALNLEDIDDAISLELSSSSSGSPTAHYSLSIRDKGMGMSPQVLSRLARSSTNARHIVTCLPFLQFLGAGMLFSRPR